MNAREKLVELLKSVLPNFRNNMAYWGEKPIYEFADCLLANDVAPVRHGRWEIGDYYDIGDVCSECLWDSQMVQPSYQYCPCCGAKMDEVSE